MNPGYPKLMKHPAFQKGQQQQVWPRNYRPQPGEVEFPGTSDRFPDVIVNNEDQQEWHESRGYYPADGSPSIISTKTGPVFAEYPKWIRTTDHEDVMVNSVEEESAVMGHNLNGAMTPAKKKPGPPKGYKRKPVSDKMKVED